MPSLTRRDAVRAVPALAGAAGLAGCTGDDDGPPFATTWTVETDAPTPGVRPDGPDLVVGNADRFADPLLVGVDPATGTRRWRVDAPGDRDDDGEPLGSPIGADGSLAVAYASLGGVVAVDARTGDVVWETSVALAGADRGTTAFPPAFVDGAVVVPVSPRDAHSRLIGLDPATGAERFDHDLSTPLSGRPGAGPGGVVTPLVDGRLRRVDPTGATAWTRDLVGPPSGVTVDADAGLAYLTSASERVLALDLADGSTAWTAPTRNAALTPPCPAGDVVHVGCADYRVYTLDAATGERRWRAETPNAVTSGPTRLGDRLVTLSGGSHRERASVTGDRVPHRPTALVVHDAAGREVTRYGFEGYRAGGDPAWVAAIGDGIYLGQERRLSRLAPEALDG